MDYRRIDCLNVFRDQRRVGRLLRERTGSRFEYTEEFLDSEEPPIAVHLPKRRQGFECRGIVNLNPYFAGLVPEGVMFQLTLSQTRAAPDDLYTILAATGEDAIGDVTVGIGESPPKPQVQSLADVNWQAILEGRSSARIAAIPGAQPKLSIGSLMRTYRLGTPRNAYIAKVAAADLPGLVENEDFFMRAAAESGIRTATTEIRSGCLLVTRFDRKYDAATRRLRQLHVEDMLQLMDEYPNAKYSFDYLHLAQAAWRLTESTAVILAMIELYAFSYLIGNGDLHARNVSLMLDPDSQTWHVAPAYDLVSTLPYGEALVGADRMVLALSEEQFGRFEGAHFIDFGSRFGVPSEAVVEMLRRLASSADKWLPRLSELPHSDKALDGMRWTIAARIADLAA